MILSKQWNYRLSTLKPDYTCYDDNAFLQFLRIENSQNDVIKDKTTCPRSRKTTRPRPPNPSNPVFRYVNCQTKEYNLHSSTDIKQRRHPGTHLGGGQGPCVLRHASPLMWSGDRWALLEGPEAQSSRTRITPGGQQKTPSSVSSPRGGGREGGWRTKEVEADREFPILRSAENCGKVAILPLAWHRYRKDVPSFLLWWDCRDGEDELYQLLAPVLLIIR